MTRMRSEYRIVDNSSGELMPGDYASIHLQIAPTNSLSVPSSALIFDARGLSIATVGAGNRVEVKPVSIERDLGSVVELASGVVPNDFAALSIEDHRLDSVRAIGLDDDTRLLMLDINACIERLAARLLLSGRDRLRQG